MQETRDQVIIVQIWSTNMFKRVSVGLYVAYHTWMFGWLQLKAGLNRALLSHNVM